MTKLTTKQKAGLEETIRKAVPESMDHDFQWLDGQDAAICVTCLEFGEDKEAMKEPCSGRPLNLQDVLIACRNNSIGVQLTMVGTLQILPQCTRSKTGWQEDEEVQCDLTKDYHHQSEEFYTFLHTQLSND